MTEENKSHGEHHHTEHKQHSAHKGTKVKKETFWKSVSAIIAILLVISLYLNFSGKSGISSGDTVALSTVADDAVSYINNYLLEPGTSATLKDKVDLGNLYNLKMDIGGKEYDSYATKDGRLLFPSAVDLTDTEIAPSQPSSPPQPTETTRLDVGVDDDSIKGDKNAPVTIIEFSDYECPFCTRFFENTLPLIQKEYIDTGKVKLIYRDFPLSFHKNAQKAAEAAECAGEQGKYYEMHDKLFEDGVSGGITSFKKYSADIGLDTAKFNECLDSGAMASEVAKDFSEGQAAGVSGTPAFFINGVFVSGAQPFENFKAIIDTELAK